MGQSTSLDNSKTPQNDLADGLDFLHEQIRKHSLTLRQLTLLTNDDFHQKIDELNSLSSKFIDCNSKQLSFEIKPGTDQNLILWKGTVRIKCNKFDSITKKIEKCRELNLKQFLQVYNTLQLHLSVGEPREQQPSDLEDENDRECCSGSGSDELCCAIGTNKILSKIPINASILLDKIGNGEDNDSMKTIDEDCCCICMDSKRQVSLPCAHSYCLPCIEQWNVDHKTCPICRETLETTDDTWVLEDRPNSEDVSHEIQKSLFDLTK